MPEYEKEVYEDTISAAEDLSYRDAILHRRPKAREIWVSLGGSLSHPFKVCMGLGTTPVDSFHNLLTVLDEDGYNVRDPDTDTTSFPPMLFSDVELEECIKAYELFRFGEYKRKNPERKFAKKR